MAALTFAALSELDNQMATLSVFPLASQEDQDECSSECSYYSLAELKDDKWYRCIPASQVREQAKHVPDLYARPGAKYPRRFHNRERLELQKARPWKEYPFCLNKRYTHGSPGPVRVIVSSASNESYDVIYHPSKDDRSAVLAKFRPTGYKKGVLPKPLPGLSPASLPSSPTSSTSSLFTTEGYHSHHLPPIPIYQHSYYQHVPAIYCQPYLHTNTGWSYPMGYSTIYPSIPHYSY
ncbi:extracellular guanyl-specific ribonuclease fl2 [Fusarium heterosporum]|uniref:Extracellular guanyl-specific ribonuclease fl2 n=1 Tax=Fusarium heterosporum TaxID=42747 RepID=A0A8H5X0B9_FUSHE|nr:extracellular guanyl-specific ribonuclease fl2 [Fusarium heterosporum]